MQNLTQTANKLFAKNEISNQKWSGHKTGLYPNILHARLFDVLFTEWPFQLAIWLPARLSLSLQQSPKMLPITLPKRLARSVLPLPNAPVLSALDVSVCYFKNYSNFLVFQKFSNTWQTNTPRFLHHSLIKLIANVIECRMPVRCGRLRIRVFADPALPGIFSFDMLIPALVCLKSNYF